jgi:uncharacterized coiled-coil DUF342 family protein
MAPKKDTPAAKPAPEPAKEVKKAEPAKDAKNDDSDLKTKFKKMKDSLGPALVKPNREELDSRLVRIKEQLDLQYKRLDLIKEERARQRSERDAKVEALKSEEPKSEKDLLLKKRKEVGDQLQDLVEQAKQKREELNRVRDAKRDEKDRLQGQSENQFKNADEVEREIKRLELNLETSGNSSVKREKQFQERIKELKRLKETVKNRDDTQSNVKGLETSFKNILDSLDDLNKKIKDLKQEKETISDNLDKLNSEFREKRDQLGGFDNSSTNERDSISNRITELKEERSKAHSEFQEAQTKWIEFEKKRRDIERLEKEESWKRQQEDRKKRDEERNAERESRRKGEMEDERWRRMNPNEEEIQTCNNIANELKSYLKQKKEEKRTVDFDPNKEVPIKGLVAFKRNEDDWLFGDRTGKKSTKAPAAKLDDKAPQPQSQQKKKLVLTIFQRRALENIGVPLPLYTADINDTLKHIEEKKKTYEAKRRTATEVDEEMKHEESLRQADKLLLRHRCKMEKPKKDSPQKEAEAEVAVGEAEAAEVAATKLRRAPRLPPCPPNRRIPFHAAY